ncbi:hypothetical protein [uncultured Psychroserpens sp.]|uniref:hypothetical protein n=1 Tax=uncultured Psychroserpens sp. TaxID=255436 RepID=UPI0026345A4B|nr:hypothetical protein [uncultured Psychroserpens sp.]
MMTKQLLITNKHFFIALALSLSLFVFKGIQYAIIGSFVPMIFILSILLLFFFTFKRSIKSALKAIKFWAILLIFWAIARLTIQILFYVTPNITETHIRDQFTLIQNIISIFVILLGIYLIKNRSNLVNNSA